MRAGLMRLMRLRCDVMRLSRYSIARAAAQRQQNHKKEHHKKPHEQNHNGFVLARLAAKRLCWINSADQGDVKFVSLPGLVNFARPCPATTESCQADHGG